MAKEEQTYSEAMLELQKIMQHLEDENLDVDLLIVEVKRAGELIKFCKDKLMKTNTEIQQILDNIE